MPTIVTQIQQLEYQLQSCQQRMDTIHSSLCHEDTSEEDRMRLEVESHDLGAAMQEHEQQLSQLRRENRKTSLVAVAIMALLVLAYITFTSVF